jgi:hypothetical protein
VQLTIVSKFGGGGDGSVLWLSFAQQKEENVAIFIETDIKLLPWKKVAKISATFLQTAPNKLSPHRRKFARSGENSPDPVTLTGF